jgi:hypothetical protein
MLWMANSGNSSALLMVGFYYPRIRPVVLREIVESTANVPDLTAKIRIDNCMNT